MDLRQLKYFTAAVRRGSISAAARDCGISQPSLSQQIKTLEDDLGESLLVRKARGVVPTEAGKLLMIHAERLLKEESELRQHFDTRTALQSGKLSFGIIPTMAPYLLPRILGPFRQMYPNIDISVMEAQTNELVAQVSDGSLEFAILSDIEDEHRNGYSLSTKILFSEPLLLAVPHGHPLSKPSTTLKPQDLSADELIHLRDGHCLSQQTLTACRMTSLNSSLLCDQLETALAMVGSGLGIAIVPELAIRHSSWSSVVFRSFNPKAPERVISLMQRKNSKLAPPAAALADSLSLALGRK